MAALKPIPKRSRESRRAESAPSDGEPGHREAATVPVIEEAFHVVKKAIDKGGYRITKQVSTREETVDELLQSDQVVVERRPIGLTLQDRDTPEQRYEGDILIIPVIEEILVTEKRRVLVEEVRITRIRSTHRAPQQVTLRKEEVSIERLEADDPSEPS